MLEQFGFCASPAPPPALRTGACGRRLRPGFHAVAGRAGVVAFSSAFAPQPAAPVSAQRTRRPDRRSPRTQEAAVRLPAGCPGRASCRVEGDALPAAFVQARPLRGRARGDVELPRCVLGVVYWGEN